jgi:hypothetical protein
MIGVGRKLRLEASAVCLGMKNRRRLSSHVQHTDDMLYNTGSILNVRC